jgi:hypothetical protein
VRCVGDTHKLLQTMLMVARTPLQRAHCRNGPLPSSGDVPQRAQHVWFALLRILLL